MNEFLDHTLFKFGNYTLTMSSLVSVVVIVVGVKLFLLFLRGVISAFARQRDIDEGRKNAILLLIRYVTWTIVIAVCLELMGIQITVLIAGSAALLVGLGLGLQQIFSDLVSGLFILIEGIIKVDDIIELDGMVGKILSINLRTSKILSRDGIILIVPNHKFIVEKITNWSHYTDDTRFKIEVGVAYGSDVNKVRSILLSCAHAHPEITTAETNELHKPFVRLSDFGDSALKFELFFWTANRFEVESMKSDLRFAIDGEFRRNAISIPFPQRDVHVRSNTLPL